MSTKIWEAYRLPKDKLNEITDILHDTLFNYYIFFIKTVIDNMKPEYIAEKLKEDDKKNYAVFLYKNYDEKLIPNKMDRVKYEIYIEEAIKAAAKSERTLIYDIECGFNCWFDDKYAYIIPIYSLGMFGWDRIKLVFPTYVEDYHYQNSTDKPENITQEEWETREAKWKELCLGEGKASHNARRFYHEIINLCPPDNINSRVELELSIFPEKLKNDLGE